MGLTVDMIMTTPVVSVRRQTSIDDVSALILRHRISGLPVVDGQGRLEGIVTELDLLQLLFDSHSPDVTVEDVWTTDVISVKPTDALPDVVEIFLAEPLRRLPVVDDDNKVVGIISRRDLVRHIRDVRARVAVELEILKKVRESEAATG